MTTCGMLKKCRLCHRGSVRKLLKFFSEIYYLKRKIEFVKFSPYGIETTRGSEETGDFDLYSVDNYTVRPRTSHIIRTDIGFKIAKGFFIKVHPRSSFCTLHYRCGRWSY